MEQLNIGDILYKNRPIFKTYLELDNSNKTDEYIDVGEYDAKWIKNMRNYCHLLSIEKINNLKSSIKQKQSKIVTLLLSKYLPYNITEIIYIHNCVNKSHILDYLPYKLNLFTYWIRRYTNTNNCGVQIIYRNSDLILKIISTYNNLPIYIDNIIIDDKQNTEYMNTYVWDHCLYWLYYSYEYHKYRTKKYSYLTYDLPPSMMTKLNIIKNYISLKFANRNKNPTNTN